jgi:hypothetical protein
MQARRNRSTRSLWDPAYVDQSWINDTVRLIPRLKQWVQEYYPGTQIGLTEYNWGAEDHINGATAQADILGILGRENIDYAARWVAPAVGTPTFKAFQMYRNYDGQRSHFGETSVSSEVPNPDNVSAFAAVRADGALTVMAINKVANASRISISLSNVNPSGPAAVWQLTTANQIARLADLPITSSTISNILPAQSITLFVVPQTAAAIRFTSISSAGGQITFEVTGAAGDDIRIESTPDFLTWEEVQSATFESESMTFHVPVAGTAHLYRAVRVVE